MTDTVLLTGISGFIAKHCAVRLLNAGYAVRGSLRSPKREEEVRAALRPHLTNPASEAMLSFVTLDLTRDDGWTEAAKGTVAVMHTASPFPVSQPKDENELIRPAVDGTLRVMRAAKAAGVGRVILTSSIVAVMKGVAGKTYDEGDWLDPSAPGTTAYAKSKVLAERAAWDFVKDQAPDIALTTVNPGFVVGPPLDAEYGSSISVVKRFLSGKDPMLPAMAIPTVDVRDVAEMHLRALQRPQTAGKRYLAAADTLWFTDMAKAMKSAFPGRKIPTKTAPAFLIRILSVFDSELRAILPQLGKIEYIDNRQAITEMGMTFIPAKEAVVASARFLVDHKLV
jgi:dihydroflavonol-4-reductase